MRLRSGLPVGAVLLSSGVLQRATLYEFLAEQWGCPFIDLSSVDLDGGLLGGSGLGTLSTSDGSPFDGRTDGYVVATNHEPTPEHRSAMAAVMGEPVTVMVTTYVDVAEAVRRGYREHLLEDASYGLWRRSAAQSARVVVERRQLALLGVVIVAVLVGLIVATRPTLTALAVAGGVTFLACVVFKFLVCLRGARHEQDEGISDAEVAELTDGELPIYTVLVPMYREAHVLPISSRRWRSSTTPPPSWRSHSCSRRTTPRPSMPRGRCEAARHVRDRASCRRRLPRPNPRRATTRCSSPAASSSRSTTPRISPNPTN